MKKNMGAADRIIRVILGIVIIALGLMYKSWWGAVGIIPILTAAMGYCPPYALLGVSTCRGSKAEE